MTHKKSIKIWVSGRVQGVGFRWATREQANRFAITGYAKNLHDGRVEILACGSDTDLDSLIEWLRQGPEYAHVTAVNIESIEITQIPESFSIA